MYTFENNRSEEEQICIHLRVIHLEKEHICIHLRIIYTEKIFSKNKKYLMLFLFVGHMVRAFI